MPLDPALQGSNDALPAVYVELAEQEPEVIDCSVAFLSPSGEQPRRDGECTPEPSPYAALTALCNSRGHLGNVGPIGNVGILGSQSLVSPGAACEPSPRSLLQAVPLTDTPGLSNTIESTRTDALVNTIQDRDLVIDQLLSRVSDLEGEVLCLNTELSANQQPLPALDTPAPDESLLLAPMLDQTVVRYDMPLHEAPARQEPRMAEPECVIQTLHSPIAVEGAQSPVEVRVELPPRPPMSARAVVDVLVEVPQSARRPVTVPVEVLPNALSSTAPAGRSLVQTAGHTVASAPSVGLAAAGRSLSGTGQSNGSAGSTSTLPHAPPPLASARSLSGTGQSNGSAGSTSTLPHAPPLLASARTLASIQHTGPALPPASAQVSLSARTIPPPSPEDFWRLHNTIAMPLMACIPELGKAYGYLGDANALHIQIYGKHSGEALYNMACCFSLAIAAQLRLAPEVAVVNYDVSPGLPPPNSSAVGAAALVEARADLALDMLEKAAEAGYLNVAHMTTDPDFQAARERRPGRFGAVVARASSASHPALAAPQRFQCH